MNKTILHSFIVTFFTLNVHAQNGEWVEWIADAQLSYNQIDNINLSAFSNDQENDNKISLMASFGRFYQLNGTSRLHIVATIAKARFDDFDSMNNTELGLSLGFRHKFGLGYYKPYLQVSLGYIDKEFSTSSWDRSSYDGYLEFGQHFTQKLSASISYSYTKIDGNPWMTVLPEISSEVFDQNYWNSDVVIDYLLHNDWLISASYGYRDGDLTSACTPGNVAKVLTKNTVNAITTDDVFGGCVYQISGKTHTFSTSLNYAISGHSGLSFSYEYLKGDAGTLNYNSRNIQVSYNYRY